MGSKDYYALLGVNQLASDDEIKRAYKQKALKHHPDKNRDDIDAEKQFMDISEAYEMLSDPYKRSLYDRFGSEQLRNYLGTDSETNFQHPNFGTDSNNEYTYDPYNNYYVRYKDPTIFYDLYVTLEEVSKGATRKIKITRKRFNTELNTTVPDEKLLEIQIKPGWKEGTKITFEGEGDEGDKNTIAGDIVFMIRDKPHPIFERSNSDLIFRVKLTIKQALLGTLILIPYLDSTKPPYQLRTNQEILTPQTEKRFSNEGLPYPKDPTNRGDLIVRFDILFPKVLNNEQRTLVDCCFSTSTDFYQPVDSVLHTIIIQPTQQKESFRQQPSQSQQQTPASQVAEPQLVPDLNLTPPLKHHSLPNNPMKINSNNHHPSPTNPANNNGSNHHPPPTNPTNNNGNNHHPHHHQKLFNRHVNGNGHEKSPSSPTKSSNKIKISAARATVPVSPPSASPSSPTKVFSTETIF